MSLYLYGIIEEEEIEEIQFGPIGFAPHTEVKGIPTGRFMFVVGNPPPGDLKTKTKEDLVHLLLAHQKTVELVMERHFVLPFKFGTLVANRSELRVLQEGYPFLLDVAERVKDCWEFDIVATWNVETTLKEIAEQDPEISACKKEALRGAVDPTFLGMLLANALRKKVEEFQTRIKKALSTHAVSSADHEVRNDEMVLNSAVLVKKSQEQEFFACVDEIDRTFEGKLHFKCIGPLPPYSFATIAVRRFDPNEVAAAAQIFNLTGAAEVAQVKHIYKELAQKKHPDINPGITRTEFEELHQAYQLLADYLQEGPRSLEKPAVEAYLRLEIAGDHPSPTVKREPSLVKEEVSHAP